MTDERDALALALADCFDGAEITGLTRLTGGASRQTWRCRVGSESVVVQRQRTRTERDMAIEASALTAADRAGVGVPRLIRYEPDLVGASTLITADVPGETIARRILRDDRYADARAVLAADLGRAAARVHLIDPSDVPGLEVRDPMVVCRETLDLHGQPHPAFELALRWLEQHRPTSARTTVVHGDFRLGNVIVDEGGLGAVIDWELVHLGDPVEDLGWLCVPAWRFGSRWPAAGVGTRTAVLDAYEEASGVRIDLDVLRWWEVLGIVTWGTICVTQAETHRSGIFRSHELAAIGRRVCENEFDLFRALEGRW